MNPLYLRGHLGSGDCIHQRALLREAMKTRDVWLETPSLAQFHDLVAKGLKISRLPRLEPPIRETTLLQETRFPRGASAASTQLTYHKGTIDRYGSILAAMFACAGLKMPDRPDFSMPVPQAWRDRALRLIGSWRLDGRPLLIYRPIVLNPLFRCPARSPDPTIYAKLFATIRAQFFVVSLANLNERADGKPAERIVGPEQDVDVKLHRGELDFETMAALYVEADLVFANPGNSTVFAQAVGTPSVTVYGGYESFAQTNATGAHLAPTLAIEPVRPCECWTREHLCDKRIDIDPAIERIRTFVDSVVREPALCAS